MLLENGIKPCWVFDGKPPEAKMKLLGERKQKKKEAEEKKEKALDENDMEKVLKYANQSVKISALMIQDAKKLVELLGLPVIEVIIYLIIFKKIKISIELFLINF